MDKKEFILENLSMEEVLQQYGIKTYRTQFSCPFHGNDKHPSAKYYDKSFYCFACGKNGDLIQFVQDYFKLDFKEAISKLNQDFSLGLDMNTPIDYDKIEYAKQQRIKKQKEKENLNKEFKQYCQKRWKYENELDKINGQINCKNWIDKTKEQLSYRELIAQIDNKLDIINKRIALL